ncbi:MAG: nitroreductase family protein [Marinifilaceae bacterium]
MLKLLQNRRSTRKFAEQSVEAEKTERIVKAGLWAPSSKSKYPWEFVVVDNKELLLQLTDCKPHGASFLKYAPMAIVILGDENASDVWVEDTSIAATLMQIQAEEEGLGSCWIQVRERQKDENTSAEDYVKEVLNVPAHLRVLAILAVGYKKEQKPGREEDHLKFNKVHRNNYQTPLK